MLKNAVCCFHELKQHPGVIAAGREDSPYLLAEMVMRRGKANTLDIRLRLHGDMPERMPEVYLHSRLLGKRRKLGVAEKRSYYLVGHFSVYGARRVRENTLFGKRHAALLVGDHIAAVCNIAGGKLYAGRGSLERGSARVVEVGVAAENGHYCGVAARRQTVRHIQNAADLAACGKSVDKRLFGVFKRRETAE